MTLPLIATGEREMLYLVAAGYMRTRLTCRVQYLPRVLGCHLGRKGFMRTMSRVEEFVEEEFMEAAFWLVTVLPASRKELMDLTEQAQVASLPACSS